MKDIWIIAAVVGAFFIEIVWGSSLAIWAVRPPLVGAILFFAFGGRKLYSRFPLAVIGGLILDGVSWHPFGTYLIIFVSLAFFTQVLQVFFSNVESFVTRGIGMAIEIFLFLNLAPPASYLLSIVRGMPWRLTWESGGIILVASVVWAVLLPPLVIAFAKLFAGLKRRMYAP